MKPTHVIKRRSGIIEPYDNHKVYASVYAACLSAHLHTKEAERLAELVTKEIDMWLESKPEVATNELFWEIGNMLHTHHEKAAYMYETHRDIS